MRAKPAIDEDGPGLRLVSTPDNLTETPQIRSACRLRAAFRLLAVALTSAILTHEAAQARECCPTCVPAASGNRAIGSMGSAGSDFSANAPSLPGLTRLTTISAPSSPRRGY